LGEQGHCLTLVLLLILLLMELLVLLHVEHALVRQQVCLHLCLLQLSGP
jgi:hypothetical protein